MLLFPSKHRHRKPVPKANVAAPTPPTPTGPAVVSVQRIDDTTCLWTFNETIADAGDPSGFIAGADIAAYIVGVAGKTMTLGYADPVAVGDPWSVDPANLTTVFDPPRILLPQSGVIS